jgi:hypothetical protein
MPFVLETIVTTLNQDGSAHLVPFGLIAEGDDYVVAPFRPSPTIDNLARHPMLAAAAPSDIRVLAGCVTGRRDWRTVPCSRIEGVRLDEAFAHMELEVLAFEDEPTRPRFRCRVVHVETHRPFLGFNRARSAVVEAAILSTRLHLLDHDRIRREMRQLALSVGKTAGPAEAEAWSWIEDKIRAAVGELC